MVVYGHKCKQFDFYVNLWYNTTISSLYILFFSFGITRRNKNLGGSKKWQQPPWSFLETFQWMSNPLKYWLPRKKQLWLRDFRILFVGSFSVSTFLISLKSREILTVSAPTFPKSFVGSTAIKKKQPSVLHTWLLFLNYFQLILFLLSFHRLNLLIFLLLVYRY